MEALAAKIWGDRHRIPHTIDALARPRFHWSCCCIAATCACDCLHLTPSIPASNRFDRLQGELFLSTRKGAAIGGEVRYCRVELVKQTMEICC